MADNAPTIQQLLFQVGQQKRWIQHSPVLPNVWKTFMENPGESVDLLLTPHRECRPAQLANSIRDSVRGESDSTPSFADSIAFNQSVVAATVTFDELIVHLIPRSYWYERTMDPLLDEVRKNANLTKQSKKLKRILGEIEDLDQPPKELSATLVWWLRLVGCLSISQEVKNKGFSGAEIWKRTLDFLSARDAAVSEASKKSRKAPAMRRKPSHLFRITLNRAASTACVDSVRTVKADAAYRVFDVDTSRICWAVLDSGIDANHPAFHDENGESRVVETYDFTRIREIMVLASSPGDTAAAKLQDEFGISSEEALAMRRALLGGGDVDWESLRPALVVEKEGLAEYAADLNPHGTHVAGILGGRFQGDVETSGQGDFQGVCPDIQLIDIRILDREGRTGRHGQPEFDIMAALQFVGHLNAASDEPVVHGVNLSIQLQHDPEDFACGRTPVCEESNRLAANGVVVVVAAGNMGIDREAVAANTTQGAFRDISIADPGNAASVITVGSTHRKRPFTYGVSFFSSRGPTGDGRRKPDLVAPGEKILGPVLAGRYDELQGTSQAAPHVSGAAAMLLARHRELIGDPDRIKQILCNTATDLGREQDFQGAGLVDVLRALQSI